PSELLVLPSSHCSPASTMPSPHTGMMQLFRQPSELLVLPSSHASPASRFPSPQTVQLARQVLPFAPPGWPGGSHVSPGVLPVIPSPQYSALLQIAVSAFTGKTPLIPKCDVPLRYWATARTRWSQIPP